MNIRKDIGRNRNGRPFVDLIDMEPGIGNQEDKYITSRKYFNTIEEAKKFYEETEIFTETQVRAQVKQYKEAK